MDKDQLISIIEHEIDNADDRSGSELAENRTKALDYYHGKNVIPSQKGKSQVVDTTVADAVEWMMPQLMNTFIGGEEVVRFDPETAQDEQQAKIESDYVNYVVTKANNPFLLYNALFRDALLLKNCVAKTYWDDLKEVSQETYNGLSGIEFNMLIQDSNVEVLEQEQYMVEMPETPVDDMVRYNVRIMRTTPGVTIEAVPIEDFGVCADHNSLDLSKARFCFQESIKTVSELVEDGYDRETVESLPSYDVEDEQEEAREWSSEDWDDEGNSDPSSRRIRLYEIYLRVDMNDDGVSELHQIMYAGKKILSMNEVDRIPYSAGSAIPQGHQFAGMSFYDRLKEVQDQKTATWRQVLDNMYQVNNVRTVAVQGKVNLDDLLTNRAGGIVRAKNVTSPAEAIMPLQVQPMFQHGYQMLDYLDQMGQARSGVGANFMGQNKSLQNDTAHGLERVMSAGEMLVGNVIRALGETIVKDIYLQVRELLVKHQDFKTVLPSNDQDIDIDPSTWKKRNKTTVKVGLGTGDRMKQMSAMQQVLMFQEKIVMSGDGTLISPQKVYNALEDFGNYAGLKGMDQYFIDPSSIEGQQLAQMKAQQPPQPDPNMILAQAENKKADAQVAKAQGDVQVKQADQQIKIQEMNMKSIEMQIKERELAIKEQELILKQAELASRMDIERYKIDSGAAIESAKLQKEREDTIIELQRERERLQADLARQTEEVARVKGGSPTGNAQAIPEVHIHNGGKKRVVVNRTPTGLEGISENIEDNLGGI